MRAVGLLIRRLRVRIPGLPSCYYRSLSKTLNPHSLSCIKMSVALDKGVYRMPEMSERVKESKMPSTHAHLRLLLLSSFIFHIFSLPIHICWLIQILMYIHCTRPDMDTEPEGCCVNLCCVVLCFAWPIDPSIVLLHAGGFPCC